MSIRIECPNCKKPAQVPESAVGKTAKCNCGTNFTISLPSRAVPELELEESEDFNSQPQAVTLRPSPSPTVTRDLALDLTLETPQTNTASPTSGSKFCGSCGKPLIGVLAFCPHCGASQNSTQAPYQFRPAKPFMVSSDGDISALLSKVKLVFISVVIVLLAVAIYFATSKYSSQHSAKVPNQPEIEALLRFFDNNPTALNDEQKTEVCKAVYRISGDGSLNTLGSLKVVFNHVKGSAPLLVNHHSQKEIDDFYSKNGENLVEWEGGSQLYMQVAESLRLIRADPTAPVVFTPPVASGASSVTDNDSYKKLLSQIANANSYDECEKAINGFLEKNPASARKNDAAALMLRLKRKAKYVALWTFASDNLLDKADMFPMQANSNKWDSLQTVQDVDRALTGDVTLFDKGLLQVKKGTLLLKDKKYAASKSAFDAAEAHFDQLRKNNLRPLNRVMTGAAAYNAIYVQAMRMRCDAFDRIEQKRLDLYEDAMMDSDVKLAQSMRQTIAAVSDEEGYFKLAEPLDRALYLLVKSLPTLPSLQLTDSGTATAKQPTATKEPKEEGNGVLPENKPQICPRCNGDGIFTTREETIDYEIIPPKYTEAEQEALMAEAMTRGSAFGRKRGELQEKHIWKNVTKFCDCEAGKQARLREEQHKEQERVVSAEREEKQTIEARERAQKKAATLAQEYAKLQPKIQENGKAIIIWTNRLSIARNAIERGRRELANAQQQPNGRISVGGGGMSFSNAQAISNARAVIAKAEKDEREALDKLDALKREVDILEQSLNKLNMSRLALPPAPDSKPTVADQTPNLKGWVSMMRNYVGVRDYANAREYAKKIVDEFPNAPEAKEARKVIGSVPAMPDTDKQKALNELEAKKAGYVEALRNVENEIKRLSNDTTSLRSQRESAIAVKKAEKQNVMREIEAMDRQLEELRGKK